MLIVIGAWLGCGFAAVAWYEETLDTEMSARTRKHLVNKIKAPLIVGGPVSLAIVASYAFSL